MVFFHRPLCLEADQYRQALVGWATTHAQSQTDYTLDAKGNRLYYNEKIAPHVIPLMRAMGCAGWSFTVLRFSEHTMVQPVFPTDFYFIPLNVLGKQPAIIQNGGRHMAVPSWYTVTQGPFETTPEYDCLLNGNILDGQGAHMLNCS